MTDDPAAAAFEAIAARLEREPDVARGKAFHSPGLKVGGRLFAFLAREELVLKLPAERCAALADELGARPLESGGRTMREWVCVPAAASAAWPPLADAALAFVR